LYIYFKSKEALIDALYLATKTEFASVLLRSDGLPLRAAFSRTCVAYLEYLIDHRAEVIFMSQVANSPYLTAETKATTSLGFRPITELLERGKSELLLKNLDTSLMIAFLQGTLRELAAVVAA